MQITKSILCNLIHLMDYSKAFNNLNSKLNEIQTNYFNQAGLNILDLRIPFSFYYDYDSYHKDLLLLLNCESINKLYKNKELWKSEESLFVDNFPIINIMSNAIYFYQQRTTFWMISHQEQDTFISLLGEDKGNSLINEIDDLLDSELVCGNADNAIKQIKLFLNNLNVN